MFAKERDWAVNYGIQIKDASEKFSAVANARLRLIQQMGHLAGALSITVAGKYRYKYCCHRRCWCHRCCCQCSASANSISSINMLSPTLSRSTKTVKIMIKIIVRHEGRSLIIFALSIRKWGSQWCLQQAHKWIFGLHRDNKGENQPTTWKVLHDRNWMMSKNISPNILWNVLK